MSLDGYISTPDGCPAILTSPDFVSVQVPRTSRVHRRVRGSRDGTEHVRPGSRLPSWPWPNLQVFVLTSSTLPPEAPADVVTAGTPQKLLKLMREADFEGDVHLVGGQQTIQAFRNIRALDSSVSWSFRFSSVRASG